MHPDPTMRLPPTRLTLGPALKGHPALVRAVRALHTPLVAGSEASWTEKKIRKGEQDPMPALAGLLDRHAANGGDVNEALAFVGELRRRILVRYGALPTAVDLNDAVARETAAEGAANAYDIKACAIRSLSWPEREAYAEAAWRDAEASMDRALAVEVANYLDSETEQRARQQVARLTPSRPA